MVMECNWWTPKDLVAFKQNRSISAQYSAFKVFPDTNVNVESLHKGENIGDLGGLSICLERLQNES
jgi:predicted metalloendopeptidase